MQIKRAPLGARLFIDISHPPPMRRLRPGSFHQSYHKRDQEQDDEHPEQKLRDLSCSRGDSGETEEGGYDGDDEKS